MRREPVTGKPGIGSLGEAGREILGGAILLLGSGVYLFGALQYRLGSPTRMGPGFFPALLGAIGMLIALAIVMRGIAALRSGAPSGNSEPDEQVAGAVRPLLAISASIVAFALAIQTLGLIVAVAASALAASAGDRSSTLKGALLLAAGLAIGCWAVFVLVLGLSIPMFVGFPR